MAKNENRKKTVAKKAALAAGGVKYKHMSVEIGFTDGEVGTATFYSLGDCFRYVERAVGEHYADRVRVELF